jgi:hypothetical protein
MGAAAFMCVTEGAQAHPVVEPRNTGFNKAGSWAIAAMATEQQSSTPRPRYRYARRSPLAWQREQQAGR